jgi:hypothetical protein
MEISVRSHAEFAAFTTQLKKSAARQHLRVQQSSLNEAAAFGFGVRTHAALLAALSEQRQFSSFSRSAFVARLKELLPIQETAEAVDALLDGVELDIQVAKYPPEKQRADRYRDVAYSISVQVRGAGLDGSLKGPTTKFVLPDFAKDNGEPYRVDSAHTHRHDDRFGVTRRGSGRGLLTAVLREGRWEGGLFIYAPEHQLDDARCLSSVKAALVRSILSVVSPRVCCLIFRPDHYDFGAWRIEMSLSPKTRAFLGESNLRFDIPKLPRRMVHCLSPYKADVHVGNFIDGVWHADLYSNGVAEDENPTSIEIFKEHLLLNVNSILERAGFNA